MVTLARNDDKKTAAVVLWELTFTLMDTTIKANYKRLSQISVTYNSAISLISTLIIHSFQSHTILRANEVYALDNDILKLLFQTSALGPGAYLDVSVHDAQKHGWSSGYNEGTIPKPKYFIGFQEGDPQQDSTPVARIPSSIGVATLRKIVGVGDINHDGFGDVVAFYAGTDSVQGRDKLVFYLGSAGSVSVANDPASPKFSLSFVNPLQRNNSAVLSITCKSETTASIVLYSLRGDRVAELWNGKLNEGNNAIAIALDRIPLVNGMYNLRLTDGTTTIDKAFIVVE
jgi:hypothetical protein